MEDLPLSVGAHAAPVRAALAACTEAQVAEFYRAWSSTPQGRTALEKIVRENPDDTRQLRALWSLHCTGGLSEATALRSLAAKSEWVRAWMRSLLSRASNWKLNFCTCFFKESTADDDCE